MKLRADGWYVVRQTGSHRQMHHPTKPCTVTVARPPSMDIKPKTEKSVLTQAQLSEEVDE